MVDALSKNFFLNRFFVAALIFRFLFVFFSSRRRHTRYWRDWSSDVCSSDLAAADDGRRPADRRAVASGGQRRGGLRARHARPHAGTEHGQDRARPRPGRRGGSPEPAHALRARALPAVVPPEGSPDRGPHPPLTRTPPRRRRARRRGRPYAPVPPPR